MSRVLALSAKEDAIFFAGEGKGDLLGEGGLLIPAIDYSEELEEGDNEGGMGEE